MDVVKKQFSLSNLIFVFAVIQFGWLVWYFYTGLGGPQELVAHVMSIALILQILFMYRRTISTNGCRRRQSSHRRDLCRHMRTRVLSFLVRVRRHRDLPAGLLYADGLHRRSARVPTGDGAVAARASGAVLDQHRPHRLHAVGLSQPDRLLLASRHDVLPGRHVEHGRAVDRHLRHLRPARADADRGVPAAGRRGQRLRGAARHDQRDAHARGPLAADDPADGGARLERDRHDLGIGLRQCRGGRHHHDPPDDALRRAGHLRGGGRDGGLDGRPDHAADDGRRRVPDVRLPGRALLGRGAARLLAGVRLLHVDRHRRLSAVRAPAAAGADLGADGAALRQGQDLDLLFVGALSALSDGLRGHWRIARRPADRRALCWCC